VEQTHSQVEAFRDRLRGVIVIRKAGVWTSAAVSPSPPTASTSTSALPEEHVAHEWDTSSETSSAVLIGVDDGNALWD
jgi:hypothetical protein